MDVLRLELNTVCQTLFSSGQGYKKTSINYLDILNFTIYRFGGGKGVRGKKKTVTERVRILSHKAKMF